MRFIENPNEKKEVKYILDTINHGVKTPRPKVKLRLTRKFYLINQLSNHPFATHMHVLFLDRDVLLFN